MAFPSFLRCQRATGSALAVAFACLLAACSGSGAPPMPTLPPAPTAAPRIDPASLTAPRWDVAIVSGDIVQHAHGNAASEIDKRFEALETPLDRIHLLSADPEQVDTPAKGGRHGRSDDADDDDEDGSGRRPHRFGGISPAWPSSVLGTLLHLDGHRGGACFAYLGSTPDGDSLQMVDDSLSPEELDRALAGGCADAPTVVVVSGCATGAFAAPPVARPNRLILTAAARGRTGFGCGPNLGYTTFDECFLGALPGAATWVDAFDRTRICVAHREKLVGQSPVEPQVAIGSLVAALPAPWKQSTAADGVTRIVQFRQGIGRVTADALPYYSTLKAHNAAEIDAYLHAPVPKALALTLAGTVAWAALHTGETPDDVARLALQRCEYRSGGACVLYARDSGVTAVNNAGQPPIHAPTLPRAGTVDAATVPFIRDSQRGQVADYLRQPAPKALALGPDSEAIGIGTGATAETARAAALAACGAHGGPCVIFADNDKIVLGNP